MAATPTLSIPTTSFPLTPKIVLATTDYGINYPSVIGQDNVFGLQFHPEKSQTVGLRILRNFTALVEGGEQL